MSRSDSRHRVADADLAVGEDVRVEAATVNHVLDEAGPGERLQMQAGLADLHAKALDAADQEALADQVVQPHAADHDLAAGLEASEADVLQYLGLDQRQRLAGCRTFLAELAVALQPLARERGNAVDRRERLARPDVNLHNLHGPIIAVGMTASQVDCG